MSKQLPNISLKIFSENINDEINVASIDCVAVQRFATHDIDKLLSFVISKHPMAKFPREQTPQKIPASFSFSEITAMGGFMDHAFNQRPSDTEILEYERAYSKFSDKVKKYFDHLPAILELPYRQILINIHIKNTGSVPAEDVLIEIEAVGGIRVHSQALKVDYDFPKAPAPPMPRAMALAAQNGMGMPIPEFRPPYMPNVSLPDPEDFHWREKLKETQWRFGSLKCARFRHEKSWNLKLWVIIPSSNDGGTGALKITARAGNLPTSVTAVLPVKASSRDVGLWEIAQASNLPERVMKTLEILQET